MSQNNLPDNLDTLLQEFARSGLRELHVRHGDFELYLSNDAAASGPLLAREDKELPGAIAVPAAAAPASPAPKIAAAPSLAATVDLPHDAVIIKAPNLGTFYRAPKPGAPNYVEVGSSVQAGDELCLIEVMKLFTAVRADIAGTVHAVLVEDGAMVEGGQPLFALRRS
ncbi:acetyl-CoA carboxylase biotin carboxyl carrier protein [Sphingomonas sp. ID0503]|uniref:acetyl-CoA carboxylase biotin carboxyl carrier protein n=1 Tax=Sphingomonas sp. ID0503 TaxID=3399691 RepID=UPI003AFA75C1